MVQIVQFYRFKDLFNHIKEQLNAPAAPKEKKQANQELDLISAVAVAYTYAS